ncbi:hypothetical protein [Sinomonas sp. B1-1]|uniref:hypothetical protein n=1 Tax=Sinomonas sp. B1-1 TaxID=3141454 RepID=UPI003D2E23AB
MSGEDQQRPHEPGHAQPGQNPNRPGQQARPSVEPSVPGGTHDAAWQQGAQPAAGWGAPAPQQGQPAAGWGAAPPQGPGRRGMSRTQKGAAAAGIAVVLAAGAGAAVYAATGSTSGAGTAQGGVGQPGANGQPGTGGQSRFGQDGGAQDGVAPDGFGPAGMGAGTMGQVLHGEYVVLRDSQNVTMVMQTGTITAVSSGSVTVKSTDGFQQTYALTAQTEYLSRTAGRSQRGSQSGSSSGSSSSLAIGQTVSITALKDGLSALTVSETSASAGSSS